ncbi:MAG: adenosylhomocysteinase [Candidatus Solibacter usitatus]|nr:adenosylhomocysteinase [Candidatus Solibacter usitatus]
MTPKVEAAVACEIRDLSLADSGRRRIEWAFHSLPGLKSVRKQLIKTRPLEGIAVAVCIPLTAETANLLITLRDGGALLQVCAADPDLTQDDVAACLVRDYAMPVFAVQGESAVEAESRQVLAVDNKPQFVVDENGQLLRQLVRKPELAERLSAALIRSGAASGSPAEIPQIPVIRAGESISSRLFGDRYGTGQSLLDGIIRVTGLFPAALCVVIAGYGGRGRGLASRAKALGASVIVSEVEPVRALEASMDGHRVMSTMEAAALGDVFITATGSKTVLHREHFDKMKNGAVVGNAGAAALEIDVEGLARGSLSKRQIREHVEEYSVRDGRKIYVLCDGKPLQAHLNEPVPAAVLDVGLACQALIVEHLIRNAATMTAGVHAVPKELDQQAARSKLDAMGVKLDRLSADQERFLAGLSGQS